MSIQDEATLNKILRDYRNVKLDAKVLEEKYVFWFESYLKKRKVLNDRLEKIYKQLNDLKAEIETK